MIIVTAAAGGHLGVRRSSAGWRHSVTMRQGVGILVWPFPQLCNLPARPMCAWRQRLRTAWARLPERWRLLGRSHRLRRPGGFGRCGIGFAAGFARKAALCQPAKGLGGCRFAVLGAAPVIDCREQWIMQPDHHLLTRPRGARRTGFLALLGGR
jgi:hypothetical protein